MNHILFIPGWYRNLRGQGGGIFFHEQACVLRNRGWDVSILYADLRPYHWPRSITRFDKDEVVPVLRYQSWGPPKIGSLTISLWQRCYLRAFAQYLDRGGRPNLIHAHSYLGGLAAAAIRRKWGIPYVLTEHLGRLTQPSETLPKRIVRAVAQAYSEAESLYAVSQALATSMSNFTTRPIAGVLPNMVNTDFFTPTVNKRKSNTEFLLCSIGDPWHRKGLDILIQAIGLAQQRISRILYLRLADKIPDRSALQPLIDRWGLARQIEFVGQVPKLSIRELLQTSDVCISASRFESFGITLIESLACGTPVIATRTAGGREIVRDGENGYLVDIGSAEQLAEAIVQMELASSTFSSAQLRKPIVSQYSYAAVAGRIEAAYQHILTN